MLFFSILFRHFDCKNLSFLSLSYSFKSIVLKVLQKFFFLIEKVTYKYY